MKWAKNKHFSLEEVSALRQFNLEARWRTIRPGSFHGTLAAQEVTTSEAGRRQDVHVSVFELVRPRSLPPALHGGDLHLRRINSLGVVCQPCGLGLHHLHGGGFLGSTVRLDGKACWERDAGLNICVRMIKSDSFSCWFIAAWENIQQQHLRITKNYFEFI